MTNTVTPLFGNRFFRSVVTIFLALTALGCAHNTSVGQKVDDTVITTKVKAALLADPDVAGTSIQVETLRGDVQLSGFVKSLAQAQRAVDITRRVEGVNRVLDGMSVAPT